MEGSWSNRLVTGSRLLKWSNSPANSSGEEEFVWTPRIDLTEPEMNLLKTCWVLEFCALWFLRCCGLSSTTACCACRLLLLSMLAPGNCAKRLLSSTMRESSLLWAYRPWIPWKSKEHILKFQERWVPSDSFLKFWPLKIQALPRFLPLSSDTPQSKHTNKFSLSSLPWAVQKASFEQWVKCFEQSTLYSNSSKNLSMINSLWAKTFQKHKYVLILLLVLSVKSQQSLLLIHSQD